MSLYTATQMAEMYQTALISIVSGKVQSYTVGDTTFSRLDIKALETAYNFWRKQADIAGHGGSNVLHAQTSNLDIDPGDIVETVEEE